METAHGSRTREAGREGGDSEKAGERNGRWGSSGSSGVRIHDDDLVASSWRPSLSSLKAPSLSSLGTLSLSFALSHRSGFSLSSVI